MLRVLLIAEDDPGRVLCLAQQIERRVPEARVCGIIYKVPARPPLGFCTWMKHGLHSLVSAIGHLTLDFTHGGSVPQASGSDRDLLAKKCNERGWALYVAEEIDSSAILEFARQKNAYLGVVFGPAPVPEALAVLPRQGTIQGQIYAVSGERSEGPLPDSTPNAVGKTRIQVRRILPSNNGSLLATFDLAPQPLDTAVSLELKSNLILRDLLVQSIIAVAQYSDTEAAEQIAAWVRRMLPSFLAQVDGPSATGSPDKLLPLRFRPRWKLYLYSLFLLSPSVLLRNWLCHWRKRYPVLFLNHHLICDRYHRMGLPTEAFLRQVYFLRRHYQIVSLSEAAKLLRSGSVREPTVVLTFDDGYEDNFINLRAVAEEVGAPVVLFVSTQIVTKHKEFTHDLQMGQTEFRALTWEQIRYWSDDAAEFHSHTCSHYDCGSTDPAALEKEIVESKRELESRLGKPVTAFAFPFGKPENMSTLAMTIAGTTYEHFLSCFGGENFPSNSETHKHLLRKRLQGNAWENEFELQNVFEIADSLKRLLQLGPKSSNKMRLDVKDRSNAREPQRAGN